jgi:hypothetical protein
MGKPGFKAGNTSLDRVLYCYSETVLTGNGEKTVGALHKQELAVPVYASCNS